MAEIVTFRAVFSRPAAAELLWTEQPLQNGRGQDGRSTNDGLRSSRILQHERPRQKRLPPVAQAAV